SSKIPAGALPRTMRATLKRPDVGVNLKMFLPLGTCAAMRVRRSFGRYSIVDRDHGPAALWRNPMAFSRPSSLQRNRQFSEIHSEGFRKPYRPENREAEAAKIERLRRLCLAGRVEIRPKKSSRLTVTR